MSQEKVWCEHIFNDGCDGWVQRTPAGSNLDLPIWVKECSFCSAKRPEEKPKKLAEMLYECWKQKNSGSLWRLCLSDEHHNIPDGFNAEAKAAIEAVLEIMDSISCLDEDSSHKLSKDYKAELKQKLNELI